MQEILGQLRSLSGVLWAHRWWGLVTTIVVGIAGIALVMAIPRKYEATARLYVDTQSILKPLMQGLAVQPNVDQQVAMMGRTLLNRPNLERVARMTDLDLKATTPAERAIIIDDLEKNLKFEGVSRNPRGSDNLFTIHFQHGDPKAARRVVQSLLDIFVESNLGDKRRDSEQARHFLDEQVKQYEQKLLESEEKLKDFKLQHLDVMPNLAQGYVQRTGELQRLQAEARVELQQAELTREAMKRQLTGEKPSLAGAETPSPVTAPTIRTELDQRIDAARARLDDLRTRFTDQHPDVIGSRRVLAALEAERAAAAANPDTAAASMRAAQVANPVYQELRLRLADAEARVATARARLADVDRQLAQSREAARTIPKVEAEYVQLNRDYDVNKRNYEQLVTRRESAQMTGEMESAGAVSDFRVVDPPRVSEEPVKPNRPLLLTAALFASIAAGLGAAWLRDQARPTFFDLRSLHNATDVPVFGSVSYVANAAMRARERIEMGVFSGSALLYLGAFGVLLAYVWLRKLTM